MAELIYSTIASLDGYIADESGDFDWAAPDAEVHAFVNELERPLGTYLYGRRMYEIMTFWETAHTILGLSEPERVFTEIWQGADKIVYSTTLDEASTARTRVEREFDPEAVRRLKEAAERDLGIGGPTLAAHAIRAGLVDEFHLLVVPVVVGGGTPIFPQKVRMNLDLREEQRFGGGTVFFRYRTK